MTRRLRDAIGFVALGAVAGLGPAARAGAAALDASGEVTLGVRAYTAARIGTQDTNISIIDGTPQHDRQTYRSLTFPVSAAGHLRQSRYFAEVELRHKLDRLIRDGYGPLGVLNDLPFKLRNVGYTFVYRGQYEGIYDYGPAEYSTAFQYTNPTLVLPFGNQTVASTGVLSDIRSGLRNNAVWRNQLFQAFIEGDAGPFFVRFGRQILAWGETDVFRLLDNINPLDNSFGGFLIPLDERRVPLDMLRASYHIPPIPKLPFHEMYLEGFAAVDNSVAIQPGIPVGSPWQLPNLLPSASTLSEKVIPPANFAHTRGGVQLKFNTPLPLVGEGTFGIAHYYTYLDTPAVQTFVSRNFPAGYPVGTPAAGFQAISVQSVPTVQITGASSTFAIPSDYVRYIGLSGEPIFRTELAYFRNEPRFTQSQLDPFIYATGDCSAGGFTADGQSCTGNFTCAEFRTDPVTGQRVCTSRVATGPSTGDSWNFVLGMDLNQFIRFLNPNQSFFITTQFFFKHLNAAQPRVAIPNVFPPIPGQPQLFNGEVLPVPGYYVSPDSRGLQAQTALEPGFVHNPVNQYLQTLLISTSYYSGQLTPSLAVFYDWSGSVTAIPQITFSRDPFRFTMGYSYLYATTLKGASGISLLRDRDNVLFQLEYVL
jgi:hypothetical protein